jgi:hypothetical protein
VHGLRASAGDTLSKLRTVPGQEVRMAAAAAATGDDMTQRPLFSDVLPDVSITGMVHADDPHTSIDAAVVMAHRRTELHEQVLAAFRLYGNMTDETLENLPEFADYGPSTIRKRRSELYQQQALAVAGERLNSRGRKMLVWALR